MLNRIIHPTPEQVRWTGLAAMVGGALGLVLAPLYSLAYFAPVTGPPTRSQPGFELGQNRLGISSAHCSPSPRKTSCA